MPFISAPDTVPMHDGRTSRLKRVEVLLLGKTGVVIPERQDIVFDR
ncbi:MAG: hypothetical protein ABFD10_07365 [Prolixibacteraceae bacterium]